MLRSAKRKRSARKEAVKIIAISGHVNRQITAPENLFQKKHGILNTLPHHSLTI